MFSFAEIVAVQSKLVGWLLFILLCLIWGSSFILMKWGLYDAHGQAVLSPYHVAALRMLSSGMVMLPFLYRSWKEIPQATVPYVLLSGLLGSFIPAFLFCIAETKIDGALAGCLNALTPLFVIVIGIFFFRIGTTGRKVAGVVIGLLGSALLTYADYSKPFGQLAYTGLLILATLLYGINVNMVHQKLRGIRSTSIAALAFSGLLPASLAVLYCTGYFNLPLTQSRYALSTLAGCTLGIMGTALASILFYMLVKRGGGLFASMVTYGIPFVAIGWGIYYGEEVTWLHILALLVILLGVYLANKPERSKMAVAGASAPATVDKVL